MYHPINFIREIEPEESTYTYVYIDLVHSCNMECNNCYLPNRDYPDADLEKLKNFISKFNLRTEFRLIGGEPTLYSHLVELISFIKSNPLNHRVTLVTNGLKLSSKRYVKSLSDAGLNRIYLSMNGFDNDDIYQKLDNMKCAKLKMKALENILDNQIGMSVGYIIVKNVNEYLIDNMIRYFKKNRQRMTFEFRNIGEVGRNMLSVDLVENYGYNEIIDLLSEKFNFNKTAVHIDDEYSRVYKVDKFIIRVNDWGMFRRGITHSADKIRGRMTENYKVAPFLSHIKQNEFKY